MYSNNSAEATYNFLNKIDALIKVPFYQIPHPECSKYSYFWLRKMYKYSNIDNKNVHKQQCEATYNFRNKSDALIKVLLLPSLHPDYTICSKYSYSWMRKTKKYSNIDKNSKSVQCQILLAWHSISQRANFPLSRDEIKTSNDLLQHRKL